MAKPNYQYEKRQKDLAKKAKQDEKRQRKLGKTSTESEALDSGTAVIAGDEADASSVVLSDAQIV